MRVKIKKITELKAIESILTEFKPYLFNQNINDKTLKQLSAKFFESAVVLTANNYVQNIGYAAFYCNNIAEQKAYLSMIAVKKQYEHCGIGTKLLNESIKIARNSGMKFLCLESDKQNFRATAFYEKHGFSVIYETERNYLWKKIF